MARLGRGYPARPLTQRFNIYLAPVNKTLAAAAGSYAVTGTSATLKLGRKADAAAGSYAASGTATTLKRGLTTAAAAVAYAVTGTAVSFPQTRRIGAAAGSYADTGTSVALKYGLRADATAGSYAATGAAVSLAKTGASILPAAAGSYAATGQAVGLYRTAFTRSNLGTISNAGPTASLATTSSPSAAIGDKIVVTVAAANSGTSGAAIATTCTDSAGNIYTQRSQVNYTPGGVTDDGITLTVFTSLVSATLTSGTITVSFSPSSAQGCAMTVKRYRPSAGRVASFVAAGSGATGNSTAPSITSGSIAGGDTIIGCIAEEEATTITQDGDTTNGTWSNKYEVLVGSGVAAAHALTQDKDVTATGTQTFNVSTAAATDFAINYIVLRSSLGVVALAGSYAVTGTSATLKRGLPIVAGAGSYAVTGTAATPKLGRKAAAAASSYAVTGTAATLIVTGVSARTLVAGAGSYAITGTAATLKRGSLIAAAAGSYAVTGIAASLKRGLKNAAAAGSYATTGTAASLKFGRKNAAAASSYLVSGQAATLSKTTIGAANKTLVVSAGSYLVPFATGNYPNRTVLRRPGDPLYEDSVGQTDVIDHIIATDPDAFLSLEYLGLISHEIYPSTTVPTHIFQIHFGDSAWLFKIALDYPAFTFAEAEYQALRIAPRIGKLPLIYRENIFYMNVHPGDATFSSEDVGHFFKGYSDRIDLRISNNDFEESCFHEATHSSIQKVGNGLGYDYLLSAEWAAARAADGKYITDYAATTIQEDLAESALFAYTMWLHPERIPASDRANIAAQIPNRIEFFANILEHIVACQQVPVLAVSSKLPTRFINSLVNNTALQSHCRDMTTMRVEALYSNIRLAASGVPDHYRFYCTVCGRVHPRTCIGKEPRAVWEVR